EIPENIHTQLGSRFNSLGQDFLLGRSFSEYDSGYELRISEISSDNVIDFLPGKPKLKKLQWVLETCMPNNLQCNIRIEVDKKKFMLGKRHGESHLGYTTYV
ncbi:MAG: type VI secretion system baseplate subunit TssG, partial [candidate division Zixibacteria bacterium]|nr:type VI secretion system baseplate subunit TssG [candidate division Zixibacteria bacterium]